MKSGLRSEKPENNLSHGTIIGTVVTCLIFSTLILCAHEYKVKLKPRDQLETTNYTKNVRIKLPYQTSTMVIYCVISFN
jgi:hypothetical protein